MIERKLGGGDLSSTAFTWIRDGVLINRMHINPVAFAFAYCFADAPAADCGDRLIDLINFGFARSGISCREKIQAYRREFDAKPAFADETLAAAVDFYNDLATSMARSCSFFPGVVELLGEIKARGGSNFITSAVEQAVLDAWEETAQGQLIAASLTAILGKQAGFSKGRDHFARISETINRGQIIAVADAPSEIATAAALAGQFNIMPVGFAFVVERSAVLEALRQAIFLTDNSLLLDSAHLDTSDTGKLGGRLDLPGEAAVIAALKARGASYVVSGAADKIVGNLARLLLAELAIADDKV
ncbi:MAG: hypothetical protein KGS72_24645 [Cyanobacteria bacterium REEB67]|nr:hypothetical protein [Cyanobacteria bacterium REEB67]